MSPYIVPSQNTLLFECSWEVCQKVGGIYTVLRSKAPVMLEKWGDSFCFIGPYNPHTAAVEFQPCSPHEPLRSIFKELKKIGIGCHYGHWQIPGRPQVILLDLTSKYNELNKDKYTLWCDHGLETPDNDFELNDSIAFGFAVYELLAQLKTRLPQTKVLAHFHEWQSGVAVMRIAHNNLPVSTIFTTHATLLGRYISACSEGFYERLENLDPYAEARHYNIFARYMLERHAAHSCTVFTTVSEVTGREATKLIGRTPDMVLPNGISTPIKGILNDFQNRHHGVKAQIDEFTMGHFFPSYSFDLSNTRYLFISGRYEYKNKGLDLFIEGLYRLNQRLKLISNPPTVVAFIIANAPVKHTNITTLQNQYNLEEMRTLCDSVVNNMKGRLLKASLSGQLPDFNDLLNQDEQLLFRRHIFSTRRSLPPPIVTHDLVNDSTDPVLQHLRHRNLLNHKEDPVKVVFHPQFLLATSSPIGLDYDEFYRGCDLGVFPSYYEPWGYTPLECLAVGVPALTSDLSGFGQYVQKELKDPGNYGAYVIPRSIVSADESIEHITNVMAKICTMRQRDQAELRNKAERCTEFFCWDVLAKYYHQAHELAIQRSGGNLNLVQETDSQQQEKAS